MAIDHDWRLPKGLMSIFVWNVTGHLAFSSISDM